MCDAQQLADRYVAVWNEPNAELRRHAIAALWAVDGIHYSVRAKPAAMMRSSRGSPARTRKTFAASDTNSGRRRARTPYATP
jgi:hypothetical protein